MSVFDAGLRDSLRTPHARRGRHAGTPGPEEPAKVPQMLRCYCCGHAYERGRYVCCRPPNGMKSHEWLAQRCKAETCGKCPRHCRCQGQPEPSTSAEMTSVAEWVAHARSAVEHKSVAEIFAEGEVD